MKCVMRKAWGVGAWGLALCAPLAAQTSLSIYSDGRTVVRRTLPQALSKGRNSVTLELDVAGFEEIERWILAWGSEAQALGPDELVERVRNQLEAAAGYS